MFLVNSCRTALDVVGPTKHAYQVLRRGLSNSNALTTAQLPPRLVIKEADIEEAFLKGSGPGGQKIVRPSRPNFLLLLKATTNGPYRFRTKPPQPSSSSISPQALSSSHKLHGLDHRTARSREGYLQKKLKKLRMALRVGLH